MTDAPAPVTVEAVVLTLDEAGMIEACIDALSWCERVHVVDSGSVDGTPELARAKGAHVHAHAFEAFGAQRNWALEHCGLTADWILFIDADEIATPAFADALRDACAAAPAETAGFFLCGRLMLDGRWLRRSSGFPTWQFRLMRRGRCTFTDFGHGQKEGDIDGRLDYLAEPYLHHAYYKGWSDWIAKHNVYSTKEALARRGDVAWRGALSRDPSARNIVLRTKLSRQPLWPLGRFVATYLLRLGFLDGRAGLVYAINMAWYEYCIALKLAELERDA